VPASCHLWPPDRAHRSSWQCCVSVFGRPGFSIGQIVRSPVGHNLLTTGPTALGKTYMTRSRHCRPIAFRLAQILYGAANSGWQPLASLPVPGIVHPTYESQRYPCDASQDHDNDQ
jgi:hypothetical protein